MVRLIETTNTDRTTFIFDIDIFFIHQKVYEDMDKLPKDILYLPNKADMPTIMNIQHIIKDTVNEFVYPTIDTLAEEYNCQIIRNNLGRAAKMDRDENEICFSQYFTVQLNYPITNVSSQLQNNLKIFKIRLANHINPNEIEAMNNSNNIKLFHQYMVDLYKDVFYNYTENIFKAYTNFIDVLSSYTDPVNTFSDIHLKDLAMVKQFAVQGNFEEIG